MLLILRRAFCFRTQLRAQKQFITQCVSRAPRRGWKLQLSTANYSSPAIVSSIEQHSSEQNGEDELISAPEFEEVNNLCFDETTSSELVDRARTLASNGQLDQAILLTTQLIEREKSSSSNSSQNENSNNNSQNENGNNSYSDNMHKESNNNGHEASNSKKKTLAILYNNLGVMYENNEKLDRAAKSLTESLALDPSDPSVYSNLGIIFQRMGRTDAALKMFHKSLELDESRAATKYRLARLHLQKNEFNIAKVLMLECVKQEPSFLRPYADLSIALSKMSTLENKELALKLVRELVQLSPPDEVMTAHTATFVLTKLERFTEALEIFEKAKKHFPDDMQLALNHSIVRDRFGDPKGALVEAHRAYEMDNSNPDALFLLARMLHANNRSTEAEQLLQSLLSEHPTHAHSYVMLMQILVEQQKFHDAFALLDGAMKRYPAELSQPLAMYRQYVVAMQMDMGKG